jgi:hypothetical protein
MKTIHKFCMQYDMTSLLLIPQGVDLSNPDQVAKAQIFKDAIDNWQDLKDKIYCKWQEFILRFGTFEETTSDNWLDDVLHTCQWRQLYALKLNQTSSASPYSNVVQSRHYAALSSVWSSKTKKPEMPLKTKLEGLISQSFLVRMYPPPAFAFKPRRELLGIMTSHLILILSARS